MHMLSKGIIFTLSLMLVVMGATISLAKQPLKDTIIAVVNNDVITLKDLSLYIASIRGQLKIENKSPQEIQEIMVEYEDKGINKLIEDKLILTAADDKGLTIRDEVVDKRIKEIRSKYEKEDQFLEALNLQGMTISDLRKKLSNQLKAKYIVDIEVREKIFVNPQDVTKYYNDHKEEFERKTQFNLQSIYINDDIGRQEANNLIAQARAKLLAGEDFDKINKEFSQTPSIGIIEQGQMVPAVETKITGLKVGEVSDPVEVDGGVYVFKLIGISPGRQQPMNEVKEQIYNKLFDQQFETKFNDWVSKLRKKAYVEIKE